jgi:hypothetical protein
MESLVTAARHSSACTLGKENEAPDFRPNRHSIASTKVKDSPKNDDKIKVVLLGANI